MLGVQGDPHPTPDHRPQNHPYASCEAAAPCAPQSCSPDIAGLGLVHHEQVAVHLIDELGRDPAQRHPQLVGRHEVVILPSVQGQYEKRTSIHGVRDRPCRGTATASLPTLHHCPLLPQTCPQPVLLSSWHPLSLVASPPSLLCPSAPPSEPLQTSSSAIPALPGAVGKLEQGGETNGWVGNPRLCWQLPAGTCPWQRGTSRPAQAVSPRWVGAGALKGEKNLFSARGAHGVAPRVPHRVV